MPRKLKLDGLQADLASLDALLKSAREMDDPVGEFQIEKRMRLIEAELKALASNQDKKASVALFFGGKPVLGSRGISADFAGHMLEYFQDLVSRVFASTELGVLGERGPIPKRSATNLMVTQLTRGSFGFVLDELSDQAELEDTVLKAMVEKVVTIVEKVASSNEIDFEDVAEQLDSRMLISLKDFFVTLDAAEATVRLVDDVADISLDQPAVHRARLRAEATSIDEADRVIEGTLVGFLPEHRKFEIQVSQTLTLYGSVSKEAADHYAQLVARGENPERQKWRVRIRQRTVTPLNRPPREVNRLLEFVGRANS